MKSPGWRRFTLIATDIPAGGSSGQKGFALVGVLTLIPLFLMLSLMGSYTAQMELRIATNELLAVRALAVAEAGIDHTADLLEAGVADGFDDELSGGGTGGSLTSIGSTVTLADGNTYRFRSFGGGANDGYYVRVEDNYDEQTGANDLTADIDSSIRIIAIGRVIGAERMIEAGVGGEDEPALFDIAVCGDDGVTLDSNARTDSYDSTQGAYGGSNIDSNGGIGTNATGSGSLALYSSTQVNGDGVVGTGGDPSTDITGASKITGSTSEGGCGQDFPQVTAPSGLPNHGSINISGNCPHDVADSVPHASSTNLTINTSRQYSSIRVDSNDCIKIDTSGGDIELVTDSLQLLSNGHIDIVGSGTATIYVTGNPLTLDSNTRLNNNAEDPTQVTLYGTDGLTNVTFDSNSDFYGAIYTRKADISIDSDADIYGAVVAESVDLNSNAEVHYDEALGSSQSGSCCEIASWREVR